MDTIWSQAGIDVDWLMPNDWSDTFANFGTPPFPLPDMKRPKGDLNLIRSDGLAGVISPDPLTLNMFFVQISPGHAQASAFSVTGLAQEIAPGSGFTSPTSTMFVGANLPGAVSGGQPIGNQVTAKVIAHEIGHNLGFGHARDQPLMLASFESLAVCRWRIESFSSLGRS